MNHFCKRFIFTILFIMSMIVAPHTSYSSTSPDGENAVRQALQSMESKLNQKEDYKELIAFMHNYIHDDAKFTLSVENTSLPKSADLQKFSLGKEDYINSFVIGTRQIENYHVEIKPLEITSNPDSQIIEAREQITETGKSVADHKDQNGQDFTSITVCNSEYAYQQNKLVLQSSDCKTSVNLEEVI